MSEAVTIKADSRIASGKGGARKLRASGEVPGVIYGRGREPESLAIQLGELEKALASAHGDIKSTVFTVSVNGKNTSALIRELQRHPSKLNILHVDFLEVHAGERITLLVPIRLVGSARGVREGGVLDQAVREIEIEVLPRHIPDHIDLDVTELDIGKSLQVDDIAADHFEVLTDGSTTICSVIPPRVEVEEVVEEEPEEEGEEPELIRKPKDEEEQEEE